MATASADAMWRLAAAVVRLRGVLMPLAFRLRRFEREWLRGNPLHLSLMFASAVRALETEHVGPYTGERRVVHIQSKITRLSGLTAPTNETTGRVARKPRN